MIEGLPQFANNTTFSDINLINEASGVVRARSFGPGVTNTTFQLSRNITNDGLMEADAANLTFSGAVVSNSAEMRSVNGGSLNFTNGTTVSATAGLTYAAGARWRVTAEVFYAWLSIARPPLPTTNPANEGLLNARMFVAYRVLLAAVIVVIWLSPGR